MLRSTAVFVALVFAACSAPQRRRVTPLRSVVTLTVVGTNDHHGHLRALPILAGYLRILRQKRASDGAVVLVDAGDLFQGTLESNLLEGAPVVEAYEALGYDAVAIGNHEFDYGPVGERATPASSADDPFGALKARTRQASFPFLAANLRVAASGRPPDWPNVRPSVLIRRAGISIGIIGVTTEDTLTTTIAHNVRSLSMSPLRSAIEREARSLRARGADAVIVAAHAGAMCERFDDPHDVSSCRPNQQEIFDVARGLRAGTVDAIVGGHTHAGVAHIVSSIPIIESYSYGRAFGRIDLRVDRRRHRVIGAEVHPPRDLCSEGTADGGDCRPAPYEGRTVEPDPAIARLLAPAISNAHEMRERRLGVTVSAPITAAYERECALGNLFTDLMLAAHPEGDVALTNGGGLRADLPAGPLTYGQLYEASPFDNRFAIVTLSAEALAGLVGENLRHESGFFSLAGLRADARCDGDRLIVQLFDRNGRLVPPNRELTMVTTDFLASGGDNALSRAARDHVRLDERETVRDAMAEALRRRGGELSPDAFLDPARPRVRYPGRRPVRCRNR